jgi:sec-independent protein translocase protein TatA
MGTFSIWHWLIVLAVVLVLFGGGGKISRLMGDFGKGLKSFKKGMKEEPEVEDATKPVDEQKTLHSESADVGETTPPKDQAANS